MNKLLLNSKDKIKDIIIDKDIDILYDVSNENNKITINIKNNVIVNFYEITKNTKNDFIFNIEENSTLYYKKAGKNNFDNIMVNLNGKNSTVVLTTSIINSKESKVIFNVFHNEKETKSVLYNHGINTTSSLLEFHVNCTIKKTAKKVETKQVNKIINLCDAKSIILPNLIVDNNDVLAEHSAYISEFDKEQLFYMQTKGINEKKAKELLVKSFLIGNLKNFIVGDLGYEDKIKAILNIK